MKQNALPTSSFQHTTSNCPRKLDPQNTRHETGDHRKDLITFFHSTPDTRSRLRPSHDHKHSVMIVFGAQRQSIICGQVGENVGSPHLFSDSTLHFPKMLWGDDEWWSDICSRGEMEESLERWRAPAGISGGAAWRSREGDDGGWQFLIWQRCSEIWAIVPRSKVKGDA